MWWFTGTSLLKNFPLRPIPLLRIAEIIETELPLRDRGKLMIGQNLTLKNEGSVQIMNSGSPSIIESEPVHNTATGAWTRSMIYLVVFCLVVFVGVRVLAWSNTVILEDYDSLNYLVTIGYLLNGDVKAFYMDPDNQPGYQLFGTLFSLPGWGVEFGARLTSLVFSCVLFAALLGIGIRIGSPLQVLFGLLILSISPVMISHSIAVLSEPTYIGVLYAGLWLFWTQYQHPVPWKGALLGLIFGLCFVTRVEGILYLAIIPCLQIFLTFFEGKIQRQRVQSLLVWCLLYILGFSAVAVPQIIKVSETMGTFALNGRQVWSAYLPKNVSFSEYFKKKNGLDHDPSKINIIYAKTHPEAWKSLNSLTSGEGLKQIIGPMVKQFNRLYVEQLGIVIGPVCLMLFGFGLLWLYQNGQPLEWAVALAIIGLGLVAPIFHNVAMRHILPIVPLIFLIAGLGVGYVIQALSKDEVLGYKKQAVFLLVVLSVIVLPWVFPAYKASAKLPNFNKEYSPQELREPSSIVKKIAAAELKTSPIVVALNTYIAFYSDGRGLPMPYTDYQGLVRYCELNNVDFLYLKHQAVSRRDLPFYERFLNEKNTPGFDRLYSGVDSSGGKVELYRFEK